MAAKKPKMDPAHEETERLIAEMEKRISKEYAQAEKDVQVKIDDYFDRFRLKDEKWREWVADGKKTAAEYKKWRVGQMAVGKRWENLKQTVAEDFAHTDQIARSIVKRYMPEVYATNFNYGTYEVEVGAKVDTSFTLYDRQTVERIMRDNPDLLPAPGKKVSKDIAEGKAVRWNKQLIQSVMTQGILQGESIPNLATRLAKEVGDSDQKAAIRNARTMATGAQNAGRVDSYKRAEGMGINMEQEWRATLDMRTRHEHRQLDGQRQKVGDPFKVDGYEILFPGDPSAEGFLIYNCRCTLRGVVAGLEPQARKYRDESALEGLTYEEWKAQKQSKSNPINLPEEKGAAITEKFRREYRDSGFGKESKQSKLDSKQQMQDGKPQPKKEISEETIESALKAFTSDKYKEIRKASNGEEIFVNKFDIKTKTRQKINVTEKYKDYADAIEYYIDQNPVVKETLYRGITVDNKTLESFKVGKEIDQKGISSWTKDKKTAENFGTINETTSNKIIFIEKDGTQNGRDVTDLSLAKGFDKNEVVQSSKNEQIITEIKKQGDTTYVYVEEKKKKNRT